MKQTLKFKDKAGIIAFLEIAVTNRNGYPELTISGEYAGAHGQVIDRIKPRNKAQKELIVVWKTKHLKTVSKKDIALVEGIIKRIIEQEQARTKKDEITKVEDLLEKAETLNFQNPEKVVALLLHEDATAEEMEDITEDGGNRLSYGGREYLVCTDREADEEEDEELDRYIDDCVLSGLNERDRSYFDNEAFKSDCRRDGRGHALNRYDGQEHTIRVLETDYYLFQQ